MKSIIFNSNIRYQRNYRLLLLSLLLLSYMVAPTRELANKLFSTLVINLKPLQIAQFISNIDIDIDTNIIREKSTFSSKVSLRELSTHSTASSTPYHQTIEIQNNFLDKDVQKPINSSQLSYVSNNKQVGRLVRLATDNSPRRNSNMYKISHQPSTIHLNYEIMVQLIALLIYILYRRLSTFNYYIILIRQLSKTHGTVIFTLFYYIVCLNIFYQILKISKSSFITSLTISNTRI